MSPTTGQFVSVPNGSPLPPDHVEVKRMPDGKCPSCKGTGRHIKRTTGKRRKFYYEPCSCVQ